MTKTRFIINVWRGGTIYNYGSDQHPQHPAEDTQEDTKTLFFRTKDGSVANAWNRNDLGTAKEIDFAALLNHNISPSANLIRIMGCNEENFYYASSLTAWASSTAYSVGDWVKPTTPNGCKYKCTTAGTSGGTEPTWPTTEFETVSDNTVVWTCYADPVYRDLPHNSNNIFQFFTSFTKRYVQFHIQDSSNPNNYIKVATVILGKYFETNYGFGKGYEDGVMDFSEVEFSDSLVMHSQEKPIVEAKMLPFRGLTGSSKEEIKNLLKQCGKTKGFIICLDYNNPNTNSYFVTNSDIVQPSYVHLDNWSWDAILEEVK